MLFGDAEGLAQCFHVDRALALLDSDAYTVLLAAELAFAVLVGDAVLEGLALGGKVFDLTVEHCEGVDVAGQRLNGGEGLNGGLNFGHVCLLINLQRCSERILTQS